MRCYRCAPAIGMTISPMRSALADEGKTIAFEGGDEFASGQRAQSTIVHGEDYT